MVVCPICIATAEYSVYPETPYLHVRGQLLNKSDNEVGKMHDANPVLNVLCKGT